MPVNSFEVYSECWLYVSYNAGTIDYFWLVILHVEKFMESRTLKDLLLSNKVDSFYYYVFKKKCQPHTGLELHLWELTSCIALCTNHIMVAVSIKS